MKQMKAKTLLIIAGGIIVYVMTYGLFRQTHLYVHRTGSYRDGIRHSIHAGTAAPVVTLPASLLLWSLHYPLKIGEELYWNRDRMGSYFRNGLK